MVLPSLGEFIQFIDQHPKNPQESPRIPKNPQESPKIFQVQIYLYLINWGLIGCVEHLRHPEHLWSISGAS